MPQYALIGGAHLALVEHEGLGMEDAPTGQNMAIDTDRRGLCAVSSQNSRRCMIRLNAGQPKNGKIRSILRKLGLLILSEVDVVSFCRLGDRRLAAESSDPTAGSALL